jgi:hypothetical protein
LAARPFGPFHGAVGLSPAWFIDRRPIVSCRFVRTANRSSKSFWRAPFGCAAIRRFPIVPPFHPFRRSAVPPFRRSVGRSVVPLRRFVAQPFHRSAVRSRRRSVVLPFRRSVLLFRRSVPPLQRSVVAALRRCSAPPMQRSAVPSFTVLPFRRSAVPSFVPSFRSVVPLFRRSVLCSLFFVLRSSRRA